MKFYVQKIESKSADDERLRPVGCDERSLKILENRQNEYQRMIWEKFEANES